MDRKPDYLKLVRWSDEDECYIGSIPDLCGNCCHGDSEVEVYGELVVIHDEWLKICEAEKKPYPRVKTRAMMELV